SPCHLDEFGIHLILFKRNCFRLEGHSTDRATARALLHDLRVHRTGVFDVCLIGWRLECLIDRFHSSDRHGLHHCRRLFRRKKALWVTLEFLYTMTAAKVVGFTTVLDRSGRAGWIDSHMTDGIDRHYFCLHLECKTTVSYINDSN